MPTRSGQHVRNPRPVHLYAPRGDDWQPGSVMAAAPLTHHEILGLVAPFTAKGRHVDLAASDRLERRLVFKVIHHLDVADRLPELHETLVLEHRSAQRYTLTRHLALPCGLEATLHTEGADPGVLLAQIEVVPPHRQFRAQADFRIASSHRLDATAASTTGAGSVPVVMILTHATAQIGTLTVTMKLPTHGSIPAELELKPVAGTQMTLPEDLLAVLGWSWARLIRVGASWKCSLRVRGKGQVRSSDAEQKLERTAVHLAQTLAESPVRFHERWQVQRWRVTGRRAVPLLVTATLIGLAAAVPSMGLSENSLARLVIFQTPPLLLVLVFCFRELPQIEIPPWPRRLTQQSWADALAPTEAVAHTPSHNAPT